MAYVHIFLVGDFYNLVLIDHKLPYLIDGYPLGTLVVIIQDGFARISSPLLGLMSGFFVVGNLAHRPYRDVVRSRFRTLYLPAVLWSAIYCAVRIAAALGASQMGDGNHLRTEIDDLSVNSFLGITAWPLDFPLHYLIDLFKCVLFVPVLLYLLDRLGPRVFFAAVLSFFVFLVAKDLNHFSPGVNRDNIFPRADLFLFFAAGVYARRIWGGDVVATLRRVALRRPSLILLVAGVFLAGALHWRWLAAMESDAMVWSGFLLGMATRIAGCLLVISGLHWIGALARRGMVVDEKVTFMLFCTHVITYFVVKNALAIAVGKDLPWAFRVGELFLLPVVALSVAFLLHKGREVATLVVARGVKLPAATRQRTDAPRLKRMPGGLAGRGRK